MPKAVRQTADERAVRPSMVVRPHVKALMLRVPIQQARPGMRLAAEVYHPQRGIVLLKSSFRLDRHIIEKLDDLGIREVWVQYPGTDGIREFISPAILKKRGEVVSIIAELFEQIHKGAHVKLRFDEYSRILSELIDAIIADATASSYIIEMGGCARSDLRHSSEVCFLSLLLGLKLQGYLIHQRKRLSPQSARDVGCLALGAMLHDIGYVSLDEEVRERYHRTGDQTDKQWRTHVKAGYELLSGSIKPAAAGVIVQHHQRFDGSGFPRITDDSGDVRGLAGEEIHVFARIVAVADHFDRALHPGDGSTPARVSVLRSMLNEPLASQFDPVVLAALPLVAPAYPPGSMVRLSNGEQGVVVHWHPEAPCQPTIQPLPEDVLENQREHDRPQPAPYDLRRQQDLVIVEHDGHDVRGDNFTLSPSRSHQWMNGRTPARKDAEAA